MLHAWNVSLVARNHSGVSRVNVVATSLAIQRRVIERKRSPLRALGELIAVCEVAQSTLSLDLADVPELGIGEKAIPGVSCEGNKKFTKVINLSCRTVTLLVA